MKSFSNKNKWHTFNNQQVKTMNHQYNNQYNQQFAYEFAPHPVYGYPMSFPPPPPPPAPPAPKQVPTGGFVAAAPPAPAAPNTRQELPPIPENWNSIYIPRVDFRMTREEISRLIETTLHLGRVLRIDFAQAKEGSGRMVYLSLIHI